MERCRAWEQSKKGTPNGKCLVSFALSQGAIPINRYKDKQSFENSKTFYGYNTTQR